MPILPLWTGVLLGKQIVDGDVMAVARDTNLPAENWSKYIKTDIGAKERERPSKFVVGLKVAIEGPTKAYGVSRGCQKENKN